VILKGFIAAELAAATAWAAANVTSIEQAVVLASLVLVALATFWRAVRWTARTAMKANHGYTVLLGVEDRLERMESNQGEIAAHQERQDERLGAVEGALGVVAEKEKQGITELLHRGPPGRRGTDIVPPS
jgi:uncharacterized membrane protein YhiD involved in acid resistance